MGVPGLFSWIKNNSTIKFINHNIDKLCVINNLYIDTNGIIHPSCNQIISELTHFISNDNLEELMIKNVIKNITELIEYVKPKKFVYIAIDGVAPFAKITQQRTRRYKKYFEDENNKNKKINYTNWSNINITPGTPFMKKLHDKLNNFIKEYKTNLKIKYSSCYESGEGEHKIIQYINFNNKTKDTHVIYGLDTDLLFLSIISNIIYNQEVYIIRENITKSTDSNKLIYEYIDINVLIKSLLLIFSKYSMIIEFNNQILNNKNIIENNKIIIDFIFLCFLIGNDFLHNIPFYDVNNLEIIIIIYIEIYYKNKISNNQNNLINLNNSLQKINIQFLNELFENLAIKEKKIYKDNNFNKEFNNDLKENKMKNCKKNYNNINNLNEIKETYKLFSDKIQFNIYEKIKNYEDYKFKYYEYYIHTKHNQDIVIEKMCNEYLNGIKWTLDYYFYTNTENLNVYNNKMLCPSWDWSYLYCNMPFVSDINKYLKKYNFNLNNIKFDDSTELHFKQQLFYVIPFDFLQNIDNDLYLTANKLKYHYLFPKKFILDIQEKTIIWKCDPIIPFISVDVLKKIIF